MAKKVRKFVSRAWHHIWPSDKKSASHIDTDKNEQIVPASSHLAIFNKFAERLEEKPLKNQSGF